MKKGILIAVLVILLAAIAFTTFFAMKRDEKSVAETAGQAVNAVIDTAKKTDVETRKVLEEKIEEKIEEKSEPGYSLKDITNLLLIGVDNNSAESMDKLGNADGIMLVSINKNKMQVTLTSFMRDTRVRLPDDSAYMKITEVYHEGGAKRLIETIEKNFEIHVDNYILINYLNVIDIVDALGGMDIELSADEIRSMSEKIQNIEKLTGTPYGENALSPDQEGLVHLNGIQTAAYMRIRPSSTGDDSGRTARARNVVFKIFEKIKDMDSTAQTEFADRFFPCVETDMTDADILSFSLSASTFMDFEPYSAKIPLDGAYTDSNDGNYYVIPDPEINNKYLFESIYEGKH